MDYYIAISTTLSSTIKSDWKNNLHVLGYIHAFLFDPGRCHSFSAQCTNVDKFMEPLEKEWMTEKHQEVSEPVHLKLKIFFLSISNVTDKAMLCNTILVDSTNQDLL